MITVKSLISRLFTIGISFLFALVIAEIGLRLFFPQPTAPVLFGYDSERGAIPIPNQTAWRTLPGVYEFKFSNNSLGLRGNREYTETKSTKHRILMLGDSFTYGLGVNDDETYPFYAEKFLAETEVINMGNNGKGPDYFLRTWDKLGKNYKPDLVSVGFFGNDFWDVEQGKYYKVDGENVTPIDLSQTDFAKKSMQNNKVYSFFIEYSHLVSLIRQAIIGQTISPQNDTSDNESSNEKNIKLTALYLKKLSESVEKEKTPLVVFYIPRKEDVEAYRLGKILRKDETAFQQIAKELNLHTFSLTPYLAEMNQPLDDLYLLEGHFKPLGNKLIGEEIAKRLKEKLAEKVQ